MHQINDRLCDHIKLAKEIASDKFHKALKLLDDCVSTLRKFECGTGKIPSCPLLMVDKAEAAKAKVDKAPKCNT